MAPATSRIRRWQALAALFASEIARVVCFGFLASAATFHVRSAAAQHPPHDGDATPPIQCTTCHALRGPAPFVARDAAQEALCRSCHNPTGQAYALSDVANHVVAGGRVIDCGACHDPHGPEVATDPHPDGLTSVNLSLIRSDTARSVAGALEPAIFHDRATDFAFAESNPPWNGICQTCHTATQHHRNGAGDHDHFQAVDCTLCHRHGNGFLPPSEPMACQACHQAGHVSGAVDPLTTNATGLGGKHAKHVTGLGFACEKCHAGYRESATHLDGRLDTGNPTHTLVRFDATNSAGAWVDDAGPGTGGCQTLACHGNAALPWYGNDTWTLPTCSVCHGSALAARRTVLGAGGDFATGTGIVSHHVQGSSDPSPEQCRVCHDQSTHMSGQVRLRDGDGGASVLYEPQVPETLERFCLSCHDADGASASYRAGASPLAPFGDGATLGSPPYPYAAAIAESWSSSYGHGARTTAPTNRLTCAGDGSPGTGCHGDGGAVNAHGSRYEVLASQRFDYASGAAQYDASRFALCFDCHANYPGVTKEDTLGVRQGGRFDALYGHMVSDPAAPLASSRMRPPYYTAGLTTQFADSFAVTTQVGKYPRGLAFDGADVWVVNYVDETVSRVDTTTNQVVATLPVGEMPGSSGGVVFDGESVWVANNADWNLSRIRVADNTQRVVRVADGYPHGVVAAAGSIWTSTIDRVVQIDPSSEAIVGYVDLTGRRPENLAFDGSHLWVGLNNDRVVKIDPATRTVVATVAVGSKPFGVEFGAGYIWVVNTFGNSVSKIDPDAAAVVATIPVGTYPFLGCFGDHFLWVANSITLDVSKIDVTTDTVVATIPLEAVAADCVFDGQFVWVTDSQTNSLLKIDAETDQVDADPFGINDRPVTHASGTRNSMNLHWYHMRFFTNFRGRGAPTAPFARGPLCDNCHRTDEADPNVSCVNCHDVHGTNAPIGFLYEQLGYQHASGAWGTYGTLPDEASRPASDPTSLDLDAFPTYCANNCHNATGSGERMDLDAPRRAWFDPTRE